MFTPRSKPRSRVSIAWDSGTTRSWQVPKPTAEIWRFVRPRRRSCINKSSTATFQTLFRVPDAMKRHVDPLLDVELRRRVHARAAELERKARPDRLVAQKCQRFDDILLWIWEAKIDIGQNDIDLRFPRPLDKAFKISAVTIIL